MILTYLQLRLWYLGLLVRPVVIYLFLQLPPRVNENRSLLLQRYDFLHHFQDFNCLYINLRLLLAVIVFNE